MQNPISLDALDHVVVRVGDLERALRFYRDTLGCTVERTVESQGLYQLRAGRSLIDLVPFESPLGRAAGGAPVGGPNIDHFALSLSGFDERAISAWLRRQGFEPGPVESRYGAQGRGPSIYVRDPDGNVVELKGPACSASSND